MSGEVDEEGELFTIDTSKLIEEARKIRKAKEEATKLQQQKLQLGRAPIATSHSVEDDETLPRGFEAPIVDEKLIAGISPLVKKQVQEEVKAIAQGRSLIAGVAPIQSQAQGIISNKPRSFFDTENQTRLAAISGGRTVKEFTEFQKKAAQTEAELQRRIRDLEHKQQALENKIFSTLKGAGGFLTNPSAAPGFLLTLLKKGGPEAAIIATVVGLVLEQVEKEFDRGGTLSTKLKVPRQALTINDLEQENEYRSGNKYITSDMRIIQKAPQNSNTASIKEEHIRYTMDNLGR